VLGGLRKRPLSSRHVLANGKISSNRSIEERFVPVCEFGGPLGSLIVLLVPLALPHDVDFPLQAILLLHQPIVFLGEVSGLLLHRFHVRVGRVQLLVHALELLLQLLQLLGLTIAASHEGLGSLAGALGLLDGGLLLSLEGSVVGNEVDELLDHETEEEREPGDVEIALGAEEAHVRLHLRVKVGLVPLLICVGLAVLVHLPQCVHEEQHQDRHKNVEIVDELRLQSLQEAGLEQLMPHLIGDEWQEKEG